MKLSNIVSAQTSVSWELRVSSGLWKDSFWIPEKPDAAAKREQKSVRRRAMIDPSFEV